MLGADIQNVQLRGGVVVGRWVGHLTDMRSIPNKRGLCPQTPGTLRQSSKGFRVTAEWLLYLVVFFGLLFLLERLYLQLGELFLFPLYRKFYVSF